MKVTKSNVKLRSRNVRNLPVQMRLLKSKFTFLTSNFSAKAFRSSSEAQLPCTGAGHISTYRTPDAGEVMLRPAVNRQPGFRRGTRRAKQRREDQPRWLAGWLAGWLPGWLLARAVGWLGLGGWLTGAGRQADWRAGCWSAF